MIDKEETPMSADTPTGASVSQTTYRYSTEQTESSRGLGISTPDGTDPANASITVSREWRWKGQPRRLLSRAIRLHAPESCSVRECDESAHVTPYLLKYYRGRRDETISEGIDRLCPFLCKLHYEEDKAAWDAGLATPYTNSVAWANRIIYRRVLPPLGRFEKEAA